MRAWAAPIVNGQRQDASEVELATDGLTVLPHTLPWPESAYRYEFAPGEEIPTSPLMVRSSTTEEELVQEKSPLSRVWDWLLGGTR